jgi:hypothetical protein
MMLVDGGFDFDMLGKSREVRFSDKCWSGLQAGFHMDENPVYQELTVRGPFSAEWCLKL